MNRPLEVELPQSDSPGQLIAAMVTLLRVLGWELGGRYDGHMRPAQGAEWLEQLRRARLANGAQGIYRRPLNLYDPSFGLAEPLRHSDSPLRSCLPNGPAFYALLDQVLKIRNTEQHFDRQPSVHALRARTRIIRDLCVAVGLPLVGDCDQLLARLDVLQQNNGTVPGYLTPEAAQELAERLEKEHRRAADRALEAADARARLRALEAEAAGGEQAARQREDALRRLQQELELAQARREAALEAAEAARHALEEQETARRRGSEDDMRGLSPGEAWPTAPGSRVVRLLPHLRDLYDPAQIALLSDEVGPVATAAAERWLTLLPHGGTVHLTPGGHACALIGGYFTYLGALDG